MAQSAQKESLPDAAAPDGRRHGLLARSWPWGLLLLIVLGTAAVRIHLLPMPLERDEGEYAYAGQLILQGHPPYQLAYNMKWPGVYYSYAVIEKIFGQTAAGIHSGTMLVNAAAIVLTFLLARRLVGKSAALAAAATYALVSTSSQTYGFAGHATHFVVVPALAGILLLLWAMRTGRIAAYFLGGLAVGLAPIMKQPGALFVLFAGLWWLSHEWRTRPRPLPGFLLRGTALLGGAILPFGLLCLVMAQGGVFARFWYWTITYARQYGQQVPLAAAPGNFWDTFGPILYSGMLLWLLAAAGMIFLWLNPKTRPQGPFILGFFLFSFLATCPGFYFREHYFILLLPAAAILVAVAFDSLAWLGRSNAALKISLSAGIFLVAFALALSNQADFFFHMTPDEATRAAFGRNPFVESVGLADYLKAHASPDARIAVIGSEPQIYFYSHLHSATGYIYTYSLMEIQPFALQMQKEMAAEIEQGRPEYVVFVRNPFSWLQQPNSQTWIFDWFNQYRRDHLDLVGVIAMRPEGTDYLWGDQLNSAQAAAPPENFIMVFRQR